MDVKITSDGTPHGTKIVSADGHELRGVSAVEWGISVDEPSCAKIHITMAEIEISGEAAFFVNPLRDGVDKWRRVKSIEFEDGEQISLMD
ncbi:hypothetical protein [Thalassospira xiamenensis]|uniref:hypothetical protein n=1 Tax=Thalassospira xiamenensis TaxID=220697 RepID=UPI000DEE1599|nr:hypothetical protein [Thalassospira xiamenensis]RCK40484.1 hypothetical protein TH24_11170 [Thalassospira xiamenensis]